MRPDAIQKLDESARRIELISASLRAGGLSPKQAARALRGELRSVEATSNDSSVVGATAPLATLAAAVRLSIEALGGIEADAPAEERSVLVVDSDEVTRDLVVLAIEVHGHQARTASTLDQFVSLFHERRPDVVLSEAHIPGVRSERCCELLRRTVGDDIIPIVLFTGAEGSELEQAVLRSGALRCISKDLGIETLVHELTALFDEIIW